MTSVSSGSDRAYRFCKRSNTSRTVLVDGGATLWLNIKTHKQADMTLWRVFRGIDTESSAAKTAYSQRRLLLQASVEFTRTNGKALQRLATSRESEDRRSIGLQ